MAAVCRGGDPAAYLPSGLDRGQRRAGRRLETGTFIGVI